MEETTMARRLLGNGLLPIALLVFFLCQVGTAQIANSTVRGTVTDQTGAVIPQAAVTLTNRGTAQRLTGQSNAEGYYTFTALSPGDYEIKVTAQGFDAWEGSLTLRVAQEAVIDAALKPGTVTATVTVTDVTPEIDAGDGTLSDVKNETQISTIPVESSNFLNVLNFTPGMVAASYGARVGVTRGWMAFPAARSPFRSMASRPTIAVRTICKPRPRLCRAFRG